MIPKREPEPLSATYPVSKYFFFVRAFIAIYPSLLVYSIASFIWPEGYVKYVVAVLAWLWFMWWSRFRGQRPGYPIV